MNTRNSLILVATCDLTTKLVMELVVCRYKLRPESTSLLSIVMSIGIRGVVFWLYSKL